MQKFYAFFVIFFRNLKYWQKSYPFGQVKVGDCIGTGNNPKNFTVVTPQSTSKLCRIWPLSEDAATFLLFVADKCRYLERAQLGGTPVDWGGRV